MRARQAVKASKLFAASSFIHENPERLPRTFAGPALRDFDSALAELRTSYVQQETCRLTSIGETQTYHKLRKALIRDHMEPVSVAAWVRIGECKEETPFTLPRHNYPCALLAAHAYGMAQAAEAKRDVFVGAGFDPDFADHLRGATQAMEAAWDRRKRARSSKSGSTLGIDEALRKASGLVELLTVFVRKDVGDDAPLFAEWSALALKRASSRESAPPAKQLPPAPVMATARLLGTGRSEPSTPAASPGLFGSITRLFRLPAPSNSGG